MNRSSVRKVLKLRKDIKLRRNSMDSDKSDSSVKSKNSFLVEVEHNHDIDSKLRKDIEDKYQRSIMNARYIFPRLNPNDANCLPKIKLDRRHVSYNENALGVFGVGSVKISSDLKGMGENPMGKLFKIPAIVNKSVFPDRRNIANANTPGPSYNESKRSTPRDHKRNTPSPVPHWRQSPVKIDKRRML